MGIGIGMGMEWKPISELPDNFAEGVDPEDYDNYPELLVYGCTEYISDAQLEYMEIYHAYYHVKLCSWFIANCPLTDYDEIITVTHWAELPDPPSNIGAVLFLRKSDEGCLGDNDDDEIR